MKNFFFHVRITCTSIEAFVFNMCTHFLIRSFVYFLSLSLCRLVYYANLTRYLLIALVIFSFPLLNLLFCVLFFWFSLPLRFVFCVYLSSFFLCWAHCFVSHRLWMKRIEKIWKQKRQRRKKNCFWKNKKNETNKYFIYKREITIRWKQEKRNAKNPIGFNHKYYEYLLYLSNLFVFMFSFESFATHKSPFLFFSVAFNHSKHSCLVLMNIIIIFLLVFVFVVVCLQKLENFILLIRRPRSDRDKYWFKNEKFKVNGVVNFYGGNFSKSMNFFRFLHAFLWAFQLQRQLTCHVFYFLTSYISVARGKSFNTYGFWVSVLKWKLASVVGRDPTNNNKTVARQWK